MVFSSFIFIFAFLPVFLAVYYATPRVLKSFVILVASYVFYAWWRVDFLILFAGVTLWNHIIAKIIVWRKYSKAWMIVGVTGNLLVLAFFKYFNFGVESLNALVGSAGLPPITMLHIILPIGISFHAFQSISFLVDVYRRDAPPARNFIDFAAYNSLFPQMIAGPVLQYKDLAAQFTQRKHSWELFSRGGYRFMLGLAKKVLIADTVALTADACFSLLHPSMADAWFGTLSYTVQLYFDFTGYSDMAIGLAMMMGFRFPENFDSPYISRSIGEFWRRWHISLSNWLRDYLYIPLGGNRRGQARTCINMFVTLLLGGLWHGANWTFVLWGAWHGFWLVLEQVFGWRTEKGVPGNNKRIVPTFLIVLMGWVMFRAANIGQAFSFYKAMLGMGEINLSEVISWQISGMALATMVLGFVIVFGVPWMEQAKGVKVRDSQSGLMQLSVIALFVLAIFKLAYQSYTPFLYFQF